MNEKFTKPKSGSGARVDPRPHVSGLTLLELLIALSLYTCVLVILSGSLRGALDVWHRDEKSSVRIHELDFFLMKIGEELENAVPYSSVPFEGTREELRMTALSPSLTGKAAPFKIIRYSRGGEILYREERDLAQALQEQKAFGEGSLKPWLEGVRQLSLEYAYEGKEGELEWREEWQHKKDMSELPFGIKLNLELIRGDGGLLQTEKIFFLPDGVRKAYETSGAK